MSYHILLFPHICLIVILIHQYRLKGFVQSVSLVTSSGAMKFSFFIFIFTVLVGICRCQSTNDLLDAASAQDVQEILGKKRLHVAMHSLTFPERKQLRYLRQILSRQSADCDELLRDVKIAKKHLTFRTRLFKESLHDLQTFERCVKETNWIDSRCREIAFYKTNKNSCGQNICGDGDKLVRVLKDREHLTKRASKYLREKSNGYKMLAGQVRMTKQRGLEVLKRTQVKPSNIPRRQVTKSE